MAAVVPGAVVSCLQFDLFGEALMGLDAETEQTVMDCAVEYLVAVVALGFVVTCL